MRPPAVPGACNAPIRCHNHLKSIALSLISPGLSRAVSILLSSRRFPSRILEPIRVSRAFRGHGGSMTAATQEVAGLPDMKVSVRQVFGIDSDMEVPAYSEPDEHVPDVDQDYRFDRADHARDPRRLRPQPPRHRLGLSRHRQVDAYRAGRGAAQLAVRARQSRQPHQPYRPDRQGRDRDPRRQAGDRVPRRHPALGATSTTSRSASTNTTPAART